MIGPVVARLVDALGQLIRREPAAEGRRDRVAGEPHQEEHDGDEDEHRRDDQEEADDDVAPEPPERATTGLGGDIGRARPNWTMREPYCRCRASRAPGGSRPAGRAASVLCYLCSGA